MSLQNDILVVKDLVNEHFSEEIINDIEWLNKGLTNRSYRVILKSGQYVVRLPGYGTEKLIDREDEYISNKIACDLGIDSSLLFFDPKTGVKISEYITDAITMSAETLRREENINMASNIFRKLHNSKINSMVDFNVIQKIDTYETYICENKIDLYSDYGLVKRKIFEIANKFLPKKNVTCHNDPLCENWVYGNNRMYLIDWEYAGMNDQMWDIACYSIETDLDDNGDELLLSAYLVNEAKPQDRIRFLANKVLVDFLWSLWGKSRIPASGDEMEEYARDRYDRMLQNLDKLQSVL